MYDRKETAIIGCGNMGTGLAEQLASFHNVHLYDRDGIWTQNLAQKIGGKAFESAPEAIKNAQYIFLAVKPQNLKEIALELATHLQANQIIISLLAGTPLAILRQSFPKATTIRIMPNLALCYGMGVIGIVDAPELSLEQKKEIEELHSHLGFIYWLKESQIDALTSLTGSGPAFMFALIEAMTEAGVAMGFTSQDAQKLILQMLQGCIVLLQKTEMHPAELKWRIASPKGTTIDGLRVLEEKNVRSGLIETFLAAYRRAREIAQHDDA